jgi:hypothetical protein
MLRIQSQLLDCLRCGTKQDPIDHTFILQGKGSELLWERKDDMKVWDRQQFGLTLIYPGGASHALTFWAMPITA